MIISPYYQHLSPQVCILPIFYKASQVDHIFRCFFTERTKYKREITLNLFKTFNLVRIQMYRIIEILIETKKTSSIVAQLQHHIII